MVWSQSHSNSKGLEFFLQKEVKEVLKAKRQEKIIIVLLIIL